MADNMQAEFSFVISTNPNGNDFAALERLRRMIREMQVMPDCDVQLVQMVQITGEPDRVEHARRLLSRSFLVSNQDERIAGA